ncbi:MAG: serine hydrolase [Tannerella sp.]|jgi:beta-glucosidase-like glycosyl hydrolase/CubicO group peptidase (beta-lactamase class C family)|nr:serine hydrolase [Tannerella sp.]
MTFKRLLVGLMAVLATMTMRAQTTPTMMKTVNQSEMNRWVDGKMKTMSIDEKIGQLFTAFSFSGKTDNLSVADNAKLVLLEKLVKDYGIGGVLFSKGTPLTQAEFTNRLQGMSKIPLLISIDGEWGLSMRLEGTTRFPKNMMLGALNDMSLIEDYAAEVGRQCNEMGIHINFAPVMDVNVNAKNPVIGIRAFGDDKKAVTRMAMAYALGLEKAGVISCAKHFPGHGDTDVDSHFDLPVIKYDKKRLNDIELFPFKQYINEGFSGIMTAHLNIPALGTNGRAGSLAKSVVTDLLQDELGFKGLIFTDGLAMEGAIKSAGEGKSVCVEAIIAGNDVMLGPVDCIKEINAVKTALKNGKISQKMIDDKCRKILKYKYIVGLNKKPKKIDTKSLLSKLNTSEAATLNRRLNEEAITLVKNSGDFIPLKNTAESKIAAVSFGASDKVFQTELKKYCKPDIFNISEKTAAADVKNTLAKLKSYNIIICSVNSSKMKESAELITLSKSNSCVFVFFTVPYSFSNFAKSTANSKAMILAYEPTDLAEECAAKVVFGKIKPKGKSPVAYSFMQDMQEEKEIIARRGLPHGEPEQAGISSAKLRTIDTIIGKGLDNGAFPGCRALIAKNGMIVYDKSFGYLDDTQRDRVTSNTVYDLASVSKATGTLLAVMKAYDDGLFDLNDKISDYIPELKFSDKRDIVIRDMLYHRSGLPASVNVFEQALDRSSYTGSLFSGRRDARHTTRYDSRTWVQTSFVFNPDNVSRRQKDGFNVKVTDNIYLNDAFPIDSIISGIKKAKLETKGRYKYSCVNFILLKIMVERLYNKPLDNLVDEFFFAPMGAVSMTYNPREKMDTALIAPSEKDVFLRRQILRGYVHDETAAFQGGVSGNAGLFADAEDLAKVCQLYLNGGVYDDRRYLSSKTCQLFTGNKCNTNRRGLGFDKPDTNPKAKSPCGKLALASVYGHTGYTGTCFWIDPDNQMFIIFLSNRTYPSRTNTKLLTDQIRERIQDAVYRALI